MILDFTDMFVRGTRPLYSLLNTPSLSSPACKRFFGMIDKRGVVRRVYKNVEYKRESNGYSVSLDKKPLKTPKVQYLYQIVEIRHVMLVCVCVCREKR